MAHLACVQAWGDMLRCQQAMFNKFTANMFSCQSYNSYMKSIPSHEIFVMITLNSVVEHRHINNNKKTCQSYFYLFPKNYFALREDLYFLEGSQKNY